MNPVYSQVFEIINEQPVIDVHTHIGGEGIRQARTLADIVSYHWVNLELIRVGANVSGIDISKNPDEYITTVLPFINEVKNTSNHWCLMKILKDLYGFEGRTLTEDNWKALDEKVREAANDKNRVKKVLEKGKISKITVPFRDGMPYESDQFIPYEYGEYLFAPTMPIRLMEVAENNSGKIPENVDELADFIEKRMKWLREKENVRVFHLWIRDSWEYCHCHKEEASNLYHRLLKGRTLSIEEDDRLVSFTADVVADVAADCDITLQIFHGMEFYNRHEPGSVSSYSNEKFLRSMPKFASVHPGTMLEIYLATRITGHEAVSIARSYPNIILSGAWWHAFTPSTLSTFYRDRLEMLPHTAWNAFFSDGYIVEWIYGKLQLSLNRLAYTLSSLIDEDLLQIEDIPEIAKNLLHDNALRIYKV